MGAGLGRPGQGRAGYSLYCREYFYYVDHHGFLFLDDSRMKHWTAALKEEKLLFNFFRRLRRNDTGRYPEFAWLSLCGRERNLVRVEDRPVVFTRHIKLSQKRPIMSYWRRLAFYQEHCLVYLFTFVLIE